MTSVRTLLASVLVAAICSGCSDSPDANPAAEGTTSQEGTRVPDAASPEVTSKTAALPVRVSTDIDLNAGRQTYVVYCGHCHDGGDGHPGTMRLGVRIDSDHAVLLSRSDLPPEYIHHVVRNGIGMMPPFRPTEISDGTLHALAAYVSRNYESE